MANIIKILDISIPELSCYTKLTERQLRNKIEPEQGIFIAESPKVIHLALDAGCQPISLLMEEKHIFGDAASIIAHCGNIPVYTAERNVLSQLTGYELTRGVLCAMKRLTPLSPFDICKNASRIAVLDGVVDSTNVGAIFRSAAALGIDGILLTNTCCDPLCRRSVRVSMGTVFQINWAFLSDNCQDYHAFLQQFGIKTVAMALSDKSLSIDDPRLKEAEKLAIVMGSEGNGLSAESIGKCDFIVKIPMYHNVDSLNVAAASALAFWELRKR